MYLLTYANPLLHRNVKKVFWGFPNEYDGYKKWHRLDSKVALQVKWLENPIKHTDRKYRNAFIKSEEKKNLQPHDEEGHVNITKDKKVIKITDKDIEIYEEQRKFGEEYLKNKENDDLERTLVTFCDLRYVGVWSDVQCREKKWELKRQSIYFRIVKRGSLLVYLTFHIFTIMIILLMATVRKSILSFLYVCVLLPNLKTGAEVLTMRLFAQESDRLTIVAEIDEIDDNKIPELEKIIERKQGELSDVRDKKEAMTCPSDKSPVNSYVVDNRNDRTEDGLEGAPEDIT
jgi:hypothetical protein